MNIGTFYWMFAVFDFPFGMVQEEQGIQGKRIEYIRCRECFRLE